MRLIILVVTLIAFAVRSEAQTPRWNYPVPSAGFHSINPSFRFYELATANDSFGGSAWIFKLTPQSPTAETPRLVWLDRAGILIHTEDLPPGSDVEILKLTRTDLRLCFIIPDTQQATIRRLTRVGRTIRTIDTPILGAPPGHPQRIVHDNLGFFTFKRPDGDDSTLTIRRYNY